jgi:hypothetical protein
MLDFSGGEYNLGSAGFAQEGFHRAGAAGLLEKESIPVVMASKLRRKDRRPRSPEEHAAYLQAKAERANTPSNLYRAVEEGTEDMAFKYPRSMGSHVTVNNKIGKGIVEQYGEKGKVLSWKNTKLKPLDTVDNGKWDWNPFTTMEALKKKGLDKLSIKGQARLRKLERDYVKDKGQVTSGTNEELLTIDYNRRFQQVLRDEGYDSLRYKAIEGKRFDPEGDWTSYILFDNPTKKIK